MDNMPINTTVNASKTLSPTIESRGKKLDGEKLKKACTDFEALFMAQVLKSMRQTIPQTGFLGKGLGSDIYQGFMDQELSQKLSQSKGLGLGKVIYRQMLKREEKPPTVSTGRQPFKPLPKVVGEAEENR
jgi:peptidoglycan hydrolase FlgJ